MTPQALRKLILSFKDGKGSPSDFWVLPHFKTGAVYLLLASFAINLFSLALPLTLMQVYDRILPYRALGTLAWLVLAASAAIIMEAGLQFARSWINQWMAYRFEHYLNMSAMGHLLTSQLQDYETREPGVYLDAFAAVGKLRNYYAGQNLLVLVDLPFSALYLYAIWYLAPTLFYFPIGLIFFFLFLAVLLRWGYRRARKQQTTQNDRRYNFLFEILSASHQIKALTLEEQMLRRYERLQANLAKENLKVTEWAALPNALGSFISQISLLGMIALGAGAVVGGSLTLGGLTACGMLAGRALQPVLAFAGYWIRQSEATLAEQQLSHIAQLKPAFPHNAPSLPSNLRGSLQLNQVSFRYKEDLPLVLDAVDLFVEEKEFVCIQGAKPFDSTALLLVMAGVLIPSSGEVVFDDYRIRDWNISDTKKAIQYVPQSGVLFSGSILENLTLFDKNKISIAMDTSALLGLDDQVANLPMGYETQLKTGSRQSLPASLVQRICMARALVHRPRVLLLDNAFSAMDQEADQVMQSLLKRLKGLTTIVMVTKQPAMLNLADRVLELRDGKIQISQTTKSVF